MQKINFANSNISIIFVADSQNAKCRVLEGCNKKRSKYYPLSKISTKFYSTRIRW